MRKVGLVFVKSSCFDHQNDQKKYDKKVESVLEVVKIKRDIAVCKNSCVYVGLS